MSKKSLVAKYLEDVAKVISSNKTAEEKTRKLYQLGDKFSNNNCESWAAAFAAEITTTVTVREIGVSPERAAIISTEEFVKNRK